MWVAMPDLFSASPTQSHMFPAENEEWPTSKDPIATLFEMPMESDFGRGYRALCEWGGDDDR